MEKFGVIYKIKNLIDNKIYIGSTINFNARKIHHMVCLKNKKHRNKYLQNAYEKYGKENFIFEILESNIEQELLIIKEQEYLDLYKPYNREIGYNLNPTAGSNYGFKMPDSAKQILREKNLGKKHSEETRRKISQVQIGKKRSAESKYKTSLKCRGENNPSAKLNMELARKIRKDKQEGMTLKNISIAYNISISNASSICSNKTWREGEYYNAS